MFHSLRSGNVSKKGQQDKFSFTSFPEPSAHDTFISMRKQHGSNVYDEQQVLSALQKKYKYSRRPETTAGFKIDFELISATYPLNSNQLPTKGEPGGSNPSIGSKRLTFQPYYVEVKAGAYTVGGTAHEKILGVPFKYEKVVEKTNKPVLILCIGSAEKFGWKYGLLR